MIDSDLIPDHLRYHVHEYNEQGTTPVSTLAACQYIDGARAAFEAAVKQFPDRKIGLSQGMRIIALNFRFPRSVVDGV